MNPHNRHISHTAINLEVYNSTDPRVRVQKLNVFNAKKNWEIHFNEWTPTPKSGMTMDLLTKDQAPRFHIHDLRDSDDSPTICRLYRQVGRFVRFEMLIHDFPCLRRI